MELFINNKSGAPIYDQIYNQITGSSKASLKRAIVSKARSA